MYLLYLNVFISLIYFPYLHFLKYKFKQEKKGLLHSALGIYYTWKDAGKERKIYRRGKIYFISNAFLKKYMKEYSKENEREEKFERKVETEGEI